MSDSPATTAAASAAPPAPAANARHSMRPWHWIGLIVILAAAAFLRIHKLNKDNMWLDEIWAIEMSTGRDSVHDHLPLGVIEHQDIAMTSLANAPPWYAIFTHLTGITHPPLFNMLLRLWMNMFGNGLVGTRSLPALSSWLAVLVFFDVCRRVQGPTIALLATALMAVSLAQLDFAQQTRSYSTLVLVALITADLLLRMETGVANTSRSKSSSRLFFPSSGTPGEGREGASRDGRETSTEISASLSLQAPSSILPRSTEGGGKSGRPEIFPASMETAGVTTPRLIGLTAMEFVTAMTHYFSAGALVALAVYAALRFRGRARIRTLITFPIAAVLAVAVWGDGLYRQAHNLTSLSPDFVADQPGNGLEYKLRLVIATPVKFLMSESENYTPLADYRTADRYGYAVAFLVFVVPLLRCKWQFRFRLRHVRRDEVFVIPLIRLRWRRDDLFWVLWLYGSLGFVFALDMVHHTHTMFFLRYTMVASPAIYALLAGFDWPRRHYLQHFVVIGLILWTGVYAVQRTEEGLPDLGDMRLLSTMMNDNIRPNDLVIFYNDSPWATPGLWYMCWKYYSPNVKCDWMCVMHPVGPDVLAEMRKYRAVWLIGSENKPILAAPHLFPGWHVGQQNGQDQTLRCQAGTVSLLEHY